MKVKFLRQNIKLFISSISIGLVTAATFISMSSLKNHTIHNNVIYSAIGLGVASFLGSFLPLVLMSTNKNKKAIAKLDCYNNTIEISDCLLKEDEIEILLNKKERIHLQFLP
ncbi:hypothetical protein [Candidatus Neoehrlichia procyonis]|uniref:Uncharacterized protein n=1 Tax=Candidatus Neoehrlichia procyonis str. RAC413 TaxID=1359163 RepID=A0A0F3NLX4_9RICK|nr:hypothetical protein [Candidatus Neoehrlichia lotoris]KJV68781.1 hypothetical protein NLO413_0145 [Candidatus Neoehrlichia lotoris str. RAC413]